MTRPLGHGSIALAPVGEGSEKGSGGPGWSRYLPAPSSFWGNGTLRSGAAGGPYRSTDSGPAAPAGLASPPRPERPLPPPPLALDDPPQRPTAGGAAEPPARAPLRGEEVLVASRSIAARKFGIGRWALTLAPSVVAPGRRIRPLGRRGLGPGGPPAPGAATAVPPALGLTVHAALGGAAVLPAGPPPPPSAGGGAALGATVSGLGVGGSEELLASLEETAPPSGPARPLTGPVLAANVVWAQGSANFRRPGLGRGVPYTPPRGTLMDPPALLTATVPLP
jgi:hypothetical protein